MRAALLVLALFALPAHAGNWARTYLKTAQFSITQQVTTAGVTKTVTVSRHASFDKAIEAVKLLAPGNYRIVVPSPYVTVYPCPPVVAGGITKQGVCLDQTDTRLIP